MSCYISLVKVALFTIQCMYASVQVSTCECVRKYNESPTKQNTFQFYSMSSLLLERRAIHHATDKTCADYQCISQRFLFRYIDLFTERRTMSYVAS